jgi:rhodanese-related sulfurtransferase
MSVPRISKDDLRQLLEKGEGTARPTILDVRLKYAYEHSGLRLPGAVRMLPSQVTTADIPRDRDVVVYDSDPDELTSSRVAARLIREGYRASALKGGIAEWVSANFPVENRDPSTAAPASGEPAA